MSVKGEDIDFTRGETERCQATEKLGGRVGGFHPDAGCRISPVVSSHTTGNDAVQRLSVACYSAGNTREI